MQITRQAFMCLCSAHLYLCTSSLACDGARGVSLTDKPALRRNALFATHHLTHRATAQQLDELDYQNTQLLQRAGTEFHCLMAAGEDTARRSQRACSQPARGYRKCALTPQHFDTLARPSRKLIQVLQTLIAFLQCLIIKRVAFAGSSTVAAAAASAS